MARALYIHWPFCLKKCPYCDFNSHVRDRVDHKAWCNALLADIRYEAGVACDGPLESVFFGGGTPSLMPPQLVETLLIEAERLWGFAPDIEITLEANPSSIEADRFTVLARAGVNRVSLGLQSLNDRALHFLGRLHDVAEGLQALEIAQDNFDRVSFDLIYALPGQTEDAWRTELERALGFGTGHVSLYQLTIEPNTRFATDVRRGVFDPLDNDPAADLYAATQEITHSAGIPAYEISNHARPGQESRHNLAYWHYADYCGIGPGAHGRRDGAATLRHKKPENYLHALNEHGNGLCEARSLRPNEQAGEALLMGLRVVAGLDLNAFSHRFALLEEELVNGDKLKLFQKLGLMWRNASRIGLTPAGMPLLDAILGELVPAELVGA